MDNNTIIKKAREQIAAWRYQAAVMNDQGCLNEAIQLRVQAFGLDDAVRVYQRDGNLDNMPLTSYGEFEPFYDNAVNNFQRRIQS